MNPRRARPIVSLLLLEALVPTVAIVDAAEPWSQQERFQHFAAQTHHWGQKGDVRPNAGWAEYGTLLFESDGYAFRFDQAGDELKVDVRRAGSDRPEVETLSIPRVGLFNAGEEPRDCHPDTFEIAGLTAEHVLFLLAQAFPQGPNAAEFGKRELHGAPVELHFLQGTARMKAAWSATVDITTSDHTTGHTRFQIELNGQPFATGKWIRMGATTLVDDGEAISSWRTCWYGSIDSSGQPVENERAAKLRTVTTFGEARQLKEKIPIWGKP